MENQGRSNILKYKIDHYHAVTFDCNLFPKDTNQFDKMLKETMKHLIEAKVRGVWLHLDITKCDLIPIAIKHGFRYHHAKKEYVLLQFWIPKDEINKLPHFATHFTGVGGVVINEETNEILVIQERTSHSGEMWKIPGGLVDDNEYISQAVEREVFEETGIKAKFQSILCFREKLRYNWDAPDIYFVCLLKPLTLEIELDPVEISKAQWMKLEEYFKVPNMIETQRRIAEVVALRKHKGTNDLKKVDDSILYDLAGFTAEEFDMKFGQKLIPKNMFYGPSVTKNLKN